MADSDSTSPHAAPAPNHDAVNHPPHYTMGGIEVIDAIEAWLGPVGASGFRVGNVIKYVARAGHKGSRVEDLKKARWYLEREIAKVIEEEQAQPEPAVFAAIEFVEDAQRRLAEAAGELADSATLGRRRK